MLQTGDFQFDLNEHPCQLIHRHRSTAKDGWDMYHSHQGMEFIFVHKGNGLVIIDQKIYQFQPGTLMYFQPFQLHRVKAELAAEDYYIRSKFLFEPALVDSRLHNFEALQHFFRYLWKGDLDSQVIHVPYESNEFRAIFDLFRAKQPTGHSVEVPENYTLFIMVFLHFLQGCWHRQDQASQPSQLRHVHYAEEVMRWMDSHFREEFSLKTLSQELHLSTYHISHLFQKATGSSITDYLMSRRLREACLLLRTTPLSVQEISGTVGLANVSYFCQLFKRKLGTTPAQYRRRVATK